MYTGLYIATFENIAITAIQDIFELATPADVCTELVYFSIIQTSDVGDAAEEILRILVNRMTPTVTSGSLGAVVTPEVEPKGAVASGATVERNNTTQSTTTGVTDTLEVIGWNIRIGVEKIWLPGEHVLSPSDYLVIELPAAPADSLSVSATLKWREIGG